MIADKDTNILVLSRMVNILLKDHPPETKSKLSKKCFSDIAIENYNRSKIPNLNIQTKILN